MHLHAGIEYLSPSKLMGFHDVFLVLLPTLDLFQSYSIQGMLFLLQDWPSSLAALGCITICLVSVGPAYQVNEVALYCIPVPLNFCLFYTLPVVIM